MTMTALSGTPMAPSAGERAGGVAHEQAPAERAGPHTAATAVTTANAAALVGRTGGERPGAAGGVEAGLVQVRLQRLGGGGGQAGFEAAGADGAIERVGGADAQGGVGELFLGLVVEGQDDAVGVPAGRDREQRGVFDV